MNNFSIIGKSHSHNDDYAICAKFDNIHIGVVCDGCSGSTYSQIGASTIAIHIIKQINTWLYRNMDVQTIVANMTKIIEQVFTLIGNNNFHTVLGDEFLDATIMISLSDGINIHWWVIGDGVVATLNHNNSIFIHSYEYPQGYPHYFSYNLDKNREAQLLPFLAGFRDTTYYIDKDDVREHQIELNIEEYIQYGYRTCESLKSFFMATDGAVSFGRDPWYIAKKMLELKGTAGVFAERRARFVVTEETKAGFPNQDDFSGIMMEVE